MNLTAKKWLLSCGMMLALGQAGAAGIDDLLANLTANASQEQGAQMSDAIHGAPLLTGQLNELIAAGKLTSIDIVARTAPKPGPFSSWTAGTKIQLTEDLLPHLLKDHPFDVIRAGDVFPNNTTFVLGHLAYHLSHNPRDLLGRQLSPDDFIRARIRNEAEAFIQGWNDTVDAAVKANGSKPLAPQQIASMLMQLRYRFAFLMALRQADNKLHISDSGMIESTDANIASIAAVLEKSQLADIE